jgi:hypothetical protein
MACIARTISPDQALRRLLAAPRSARREVRATSALKALATCRA